MKKRTRFTHLDEQGKARMVEVSEKTATRREATAVGKITMSPQVLRKITFGNVAKGEVLSIARIAGILAAKKTHELIPLCHPLVLDWIEISFKMDLDGIKIQSTVRSFGKTGVEMEALTAVSIAALTVYDMCKAIDKSMTLGPFYLARKSGGKSGLYIRNLS